MKKAFLICMALALQCAGSVAQVCWNISDEDNGIQLVVMKSPNYARWGHNPGDGGVAVLG